MFNSLILNKHLCLHVLFVFANNKINLPSKQTDSILFQKMSGGEFEVTKQNKVLRMRKRGVYDRKTIYDVLSKGVIASIGITMPADGDMPSFPLVLPLLYGYDKSFDDSSSNDDKEDVVYLHGSISNKMLRTMTKTSNNESTSSTRTTSTSSHAQQTAVCINVTLLDGLVLAKSTFNSSCNYRSVCLFGHCEAVLDESEKLRALELISNHTCDGRWQQTRLPSKAELQATSVVKVFIHSASAKIRAEGVGELKADLDDPALATVWSGVVPMRQHQYLTPVRDEDDPNQIVVPSNITQMIENRNK